ncbi:SurA N-terminal domain-containing protein [Microlunatus flavus]|uniref:SurA N-terminal domain-containing protein n=1 Tax=Microlunatus flavus TaxID=1036181 RepID=A0A1H9K559_9ACTN|nr:SurA N-terminal domain-containing protein [Microlunatus flavus]SEQ94037.1 SurA N-terminal domain-containing protein [Microlunatus flavus]
MRSSAAPHRRPRRHRILAAAALSLAVLGTGAGCANANPAVAAYVDGTAITQTQLDAAVAGVEKTVQEGQQVSPQAVLDAMVHGVIAEKIAAKNGITVTDADRDAALKGSNLEPLLPFPAAKEVAYDIADQQIVAQKVGSQPYLEQVAQQKVTVNPRFGVLDEQQKLVNGDQSGSLARPSSPSPTPTP